MNDATTSLLVAAIGALSGLFPIAVGLIIKWVEQRSEEHTRKRAIERAQKRLEFLNLWIRTQQLIRPHAEFAKLANEVREELEALRDDIRLRTSIQDGTTLSGMGDRGVQSRNEVSPWRKGILAYFPKTAAGWAFHLLFYMAFGASVLLTAWVIYATVAIGNPGSTPLDWITLAYGPLVLAFVLTYLLFWLPARIIDNRYRKRLIEGSADLNSA